MQKSFFIRICKIFLTAATFHVKYIFLIPLRLNIGERIVLSMVVFSFQRSIHFLTYTFN